MIARLRGKLITIRPSCVVDVGGVGFELLVPEKDRDALQDQAGEVSFFTYLYVREDRLTLFGFLHAEDRELFTKLIDVSGVGPKIAIGLMGAHPTDRIINAIRLEDHAFLCKLPGLGKRTAERLTVELKDKLDNLAPQAAATVVSGSYALREEAILALASLGMPRVAAERALEQVDWQSKDAASMADIVKEALKHASGV